jgi:diguanylate cyclase (GGDEF)-like protein
VAAPVGLDQASQVPAADEPADEGAGSGPDARDRSILRRWRQVAVIALAGVGATLLIALWRSNADVLSLLGLVAFVIVLAALAMQYRLGSAADERRAAREAGQTRMLQGLSRSFSSDAIVETIVDELRRAADADHVVVARLRPIERVVETTLVSSRAMVPPARSILPASVLDAPTPTGRRRGRPQVLGGRASHQAVAESLAARLGESYALSHTLSAPLVVGSRVVGALILSRRQKRDWTVVDRRLLTWSAEELSAALARAYAFERAEVRASIDGLTGLPNRRYLEELLATVGPRRRSGDRLGVLMIDLDHFKGLNDRYGHAAGDRVLRAVAERISSAVRAEDTPARYGGEEFAVVLRRADPQQAVEVAERIRQQIKDIATRDVGVGERISVSIGVAVADSHLADAQALLGAADEALYRAKREGRDRVVLASSR